MTTFDGAQYDFQFAGDHFILYDDFKDTRVTAGFQKCGFAAACNCAVYLKKRNKLVFLDFCSASGPASPAAQQFYGVSLEKRVIGPNAIKKLPNCQPLRLSEENDEQAWRNISTFLDNFKCAKLQGSNYYETVVLRTVENNFDDSVKIRVQFSNRNLPDIAVVPSRSSFKNTGGLCGMWDGVSSHDKELYVMDADGLDEYLPNLRDLDRARDFWKLSSRYNKDYEVIKRCPDCYLMAERSYYCPCDNFNLFNNSNYQLEHPGRSSYCSVPMSQCIEEKFSFGNGTIPDPDPVDPEPCDESCAFDVCNNGIRNSSVAAQIESGCFDPTFSIQICAEDVLASQRRELVNVHIALAADRALQNIINNIQAGNDTCSLVDPPCPNSCSGHGVCVSKPECVDNVSNQCLSPIVCECDANWGGKDCNLDLSQVPSFELDRQCCDLRNENCEIFNGRGYPYSLKNPIYVRTQFVERLVDGSEHIVENVKIVNAAAENLLVFSISGFEELTLYKNIHNQPSSRVLAEAETQVRVSISYSNSSFDTTSSFSLYDSNCRDCESGSTSVRGNSCDIRGICYVDGAVSIADTNLACKPEQNNTNWSYEPDPRCDGLGSHRWSSWINLDDPSGDGDIEILSLKPNLRCDFISTQVRVAGTGPLLQYVTGQNYHYNDSCYGFMCLNNEQESGVDCLDYEIRQCCPHSGSVTTAQVLTTAEQIDSTYRVFSTDEPDYETSEQENITTTAASSLSTDGQDPLPLSTDNYDVTENDETTQGEVDTETTIIDTTTTTTSASCNYDVQIVQLENFYEDRIVVREDSEYARLKYQLVGDCDLSNVNARVFLSTASGTAQQSVDFDGNSDSNVLNSNVINDFSVNIIDDNNIEPFEFFTINLNYEINGVNRSLSQLVYIQDDDFGSGQESNPFEILTSNSTSDDFIIVYKDSSNEFFYPSNSDAIRPGEGGVSIDQNQLTVFFDYLGDFELELQTIEVHNPAECNLESFSARRNDQSSRPIDKFDLKSISIADVPVVDVSYLILYEDSTIPRLDLEQLRINLESPNNSTISNCEFRIFATRK